MIDLEGKRVLFIAPKFYTYHTQIIDFIEAKKGYVTFYPEDIYTPFYRFTQKLFPSIASKLKKRYRDHIIESVTTDGYDIVFVIRGGILSPSAMEALKQKLPKARFIMYQWDSNRQSNYKPLIDYFDVVKTFDRVDAREYALEYLPLFYTDRFTQIANNKLPKQYDLVFYGAYHSDRLKIVQQIEQFCQNNHLRFKYHLYITKMALFRLFCFGVISLKDLKYLKIYSVDMNHILNVYRSSFATLDIELNIQHGLTMRTFEALGAGLKLITTNAQIQEEPFYNPQNIALLDRNHIHIDLDFFKSPFSLDPCLKHYHIDQWLTTLLTQADPS